MKKMTFPLFVSLGMLTTTAYATPPIEILYEHETAAVYEDIVDEDEHGNYVTRCYMKWKDKDSGNTIVFHHNHEYMVASFNVTFDFHEVQAPTPYVGSVMFYTFGGKSISTHLLVQGYNHFLGREYEYHAFIDDEKIFDMILNDKIKDKFIFAYHNLDPLRTRGYIMEVTPEIKVSMDVFSSCLINAHESVLDLIERKKKK